jgi:hypothetical protein
MGDQTETADALDQRATPSLDGDLVDVEVLSRWMDEQGLPPGPI